MTRTLKFKPWRPSIERLVFVFVVLWTVAVVRAQPVISADKLADDHVTKAIDAMVAELYARKHAERFWEPEKTPPGDSARQRGGYTALAVLALLSAGQTYQDPRLNDAVQYLADFGMEGTYAISVRTSVWARLPMKFREKLDIDTKWLLDGFSESAGGWDYDSNPRTNRKDNSIRQFGALALWEAAKRGVKIDRKYWQRLEDAFIDLQLPDGGWNYTGDGKATGSMTAAGLATLFITQDFLHAAETARPGAAGQSRHRSAIESGLAWMDKNFSATENPGKGLYFYYYLYGVERVGLASGYKYFGARDWYREGTAELLRRLCQWNEASQAFTIHATTAGDGRASKIRTDDLAFALMFLSRGRVPVAINKLQIPSFNWNNRPRDVANLTHWIGDNSESALSWQIASCAAEPEAWLDAPILYLASHERLPWLKDLKLDVGQYVKDIGEFHRKRATGEAALDAQPPQRPNIPELEKIKRYLELGGTVLAVNEGGTRHFAESIEDIGLLLFPQYQWRTLPEDHPAYTIHTPVKARQPLKGLSNGVRDLIVLCSAGDWSQTFQKSDSKQASEFQTATNIFFAASEMNRTRPRLARPMRAETSASASAPATQPKTHITIVRAVHADNWNPEPQAISAFATNLKATRGIDIDIVEATLSTIHTVDPKTSLLFVNGVAEHVFTASEQDAIKAFAQSGGLILFETPGGRGNFTLSAEQMATDLFRSPIQSLLRSPVITGEGLSGAKDLTLLDYRPYTLQAWGTRETSPRLRGMALKDGGPPRIFFSREDISHALLDQPCWGVAGYSAQAARELMANFVQFAIAARN